MNKSKVKKIFKIAADVVIYLFLAIAVCSVFLTVLGPKSTDGATEIFGYQIRLVTTNSMAQGEATDTSGYDIKSIPQGSVVFIETVPDDKQAAAEWFENEVKIGDVLTFKYLYEKQIVITHRVVDKYPDPDGEGYVIVLEGDNKDFDSKLLQQTIYTSEKEPVNYVIGKVRGSSYVLGVFIGAMKEPLSLLLIIILPCSAVIIYELIKIARALGSEKKEKQRAESNRKDEEILELKKQLEALKQKDALQDFANSAPMTQQTVPEADQIDSTSVETPSNNTDA